MNTPLTGERIFEDVCDDRGNSYEEPFVVVSVVECALQGLKKDFNYPTEDVMSNYVKKRIDYWFPAFKEGIDIDEENKKLKHTGLVLTKASASVATKITDNEVVKFMEITKRVLESHENSIIKLQNKVKKDD